MKQTTDYSALSDRDLQFLQMGRATVIPGYQRAMDTIQAELELMKQEMYMIQNERTARQALDGAVELTSTRKQLKQAAQLHDAGKLLAAGKHDKRGKASKSYWATLTPEERSTEMKRRQVVAAAKRKGKKKLHPRDKEHPGHEEWVKMMTKATRRSWKKRTPQQKAQTVRNLVEARRAKASMPRVTLEKTA